MKRNEKGFTLIELLVVIPIVAIVSIAAAMVIFQIFRNTERSSNHMAAVLQVQNAGNQISHDAQRAQNVSTNLTLPNFLVLSWIDGNSNDVYQITYTLDNMPGTTMKAFTRNQSVNGSDNTSSPLAQYIDSNPQNTSCTFTNGLLTLTITSTQGSGATIQSENRTYQIVPRPS